MSSTGAGSPLVATPNQFDKDVESQTWTDRFDSWLERASERLNPILVKEARQSLKSQQFLSTFSLLLICAWAWSVIGIVLLLPGVYYMPGGRVLLVGYFFVLAVPLLVIVPFSAYRSLVSEREDGTFELLAISTLSARQIVTGKMGSAILQMLVYYSALSPCIAVTYLLRGVDVFTIGILLFYTFLLSNLLASLGLLTATLTSARHWQVLLSVILLVALAGATMMWTFPFTAVILEGESIPFDDPDFWVAQLAIVTAALSYLALAILASASMLSFPSDNRSTRLRIVMLGQQLLIVGWLIYSWLRAEEEVLLMFLLAAAAAHWYLMGTLLSGELAQLSPRVKRSLPQSFLGRMTLTWFNPGSGTGYTFAVTNLATVVVVAFVAGVIAQIAGMAAAPKDMDWAAYGILVWGYVAAYLGVTRPIVRLIQPYSHAGLLLPFLLNVLVAVLGCAIPLFLQAWLTNFWELTYSPLQATNWFWTLMEVARSGTVGRELVVLVVGLTGSVVFLFNLVLTYREVEQVRTATPARVEQDEIELHPEKARHPPRRDPLAPPESLGPSPFGPGK